MKYLIAYTEAGSKTFCDLVFLGLQPKPNSGTTSAWTDYTLHPTSGIPLISIPESFVIPIASNVDAGLFDYAFQAYLDEGVINQPQINSIKENVTAASGSTIDFGAELISLFNGTNKLIGYADALEGGWLK
jgi:hypothetical protein